MRYDAKSVGYKTNHHGAEVHWVFKEEDIRAIDAKEQPVGPSVERNRELRAIELLVQGKSLIEIVRQTKLRLRDALYIRDLYLAETDKEEKK